MDRRDILKLFNHPVPRISGAGENYAAGKLPKKMPAAARNKKNGLPGIILFLAILLLPFISSSGKVFWRCLPDQDRPGYGPAGGANRIYQAPLVINGARFLLAVYGYDEPPEQARAKIKRHFEKENTASILLTAAAPGSERALAFVFSRFAAETARPPPPPPGGICAGYPLFTGKEPETRIRNEETGVVLESGTIAGAPEMIAAEITAKLERNNWQPAYPAVRPPGRGNSGKYFMIFRKGKALCALITGPALRENETCVTLLLKEKTDDMGE